MWKLVGKEIELGEDLRPESPSHGSFPAAALSGALIGVNGCLSSLRFLTVQLNMRTKKYSANGSQSLCIGHRKTLPRSLVFLTAAQIRCTLQDREFLLLLADQIQRAIVKKILGPIQEIKMTFWLHN